MKKRIAILVCTILLTLVPAMAEEYTIGVLLSETSNTFFITMKNAIEARGAELGVKTIILDSANDSVKDITNMEDLIANGVDFVLYDPVDSDAAAIVVEEAAGAGIPVITIDRAANGAEIVSHIASDNVYGGRIATEKLIELMGGEGVIAEIQGMAGTSAANDRHLGFEEAVSATGGKITVASSQIGDWDTTKAMGIMENILMANPEVKGVFCANDSMAIGAIQACQQAGRSDIIIVGFDAEQIALDAIEEGTLAATVQQQPALMGELGIENALKYLAGEAVEPNINVPVALIPNE